MKRTALLAAYALVIHVALAVAIAKPDLIRQIAGKPKPWIARMHAVHVAADRNVPDGMAVFLGDSITQRLPATLVAPDAINYAIGSQTSRDLGMHAAEYQALRSARIVYLLVGVNDLAQEMQPDFESVLETIPPGTPLVWTGIMKARAIDGIDAANDAARSLCASRPACIFVDPGITDSDLDDDGVHLNPAGYRKWVDSLRAASANTPSVLNER